MVTSIIVCNAGSDLLSKIDLKTKIVSNIEYSLCEKPIGPHSIKKVGDKIITANSYNDSVSIYEEKYFKELYNIKVGRKPNDIVLLDNILYTVCGDSNAVNVHDINSERLLWTIGTSGWPHSIDYSSLYEKLYVSSIEEDTIDIIDEKDKRRIGKIVAKEYPIKVKVSLDNKYIYVCESYIGSDNGGYIEVFDLANNTSIARVKVGNSPMDIYENSENLYITNFTDGTISILNKKEFKVTNTIYVGGMPKGIVVNDSKIYAIDYLKGNLIEIENENKKNIIAIGMDPGAMILLEDSSEKRLEIIFVYNSEGSSFHFAQIEVACFLEGTEIFKSISKFSSSNAFKLTI